MVCSLAKHRRSTRTDPTAKFNDIQFCLFRSACNASSYVYVRRSCFAGNFAGISVDLVEADCTVPDSGRTTGVVAEIVRRERLAVALVG